MSGSPAAMGAADRAWSQFWSHSPPSAAVHRRPRVPVRTGHGRWRTPGSIIGKRVGGNPSGVRISYPPPPVTRQYSGWVMLADRPGRLRSLIYSLILLHILIKASNLTFCHVGGVAPVVPSAPLEGC